MANNSDLIITRHVRERYIQRTNKRFRKLQWSEFEKDQERMKLLKKELDQLIKNEQWDIDQEIFQRLKNSTESRSFINNTGFMEWYHEKYGYDKRFQFLVDSELLFVVILEKGRRIVVTCVEAKTHLAGKAVLSKKKFRKKKKVDEYENMH
jgi:hypothetical protein